MADVCGQCGVPFVGHPTKRYCTSLCRRRARFSREMASGVAQDKWRRAEAKRSRRRGNASITKPRLRCEWCDEWMDDRRGSLSRRFCSLTCANRGRVIGRSCPWPRERECPIPWGECDFCGRMIVKRCGRQYCSVACADYGIGRRLSHAIWPRECRRCGRIFIGRSPRQECCSQACAKRATRSLRRHRERYRRSGGERFTLREIAERDGWRCHICGKKVLDRPYRSRDSDPTMDHLIPQSEGGAHVRSNVALAHNRCNWERSIGGEVQLRLVG